MRKFLKIIYKSFVALLIGGICFSLATGIYIYYYQEQVIAKAFRAITAQSPYPIQAKNVKLSLFKDFPKMSLLLNGVIIQAPHQVPNKLLTANKIDCVFNMWDLFQGQYILHELYIEQGILSFYSQEQYKQAEYKIPAKGEGVTEVKQSHLFFPINLKKLVLNGIKCVYTTNSPVQQYEIYAQHVQANCNTSLQDLSLQVAGEVVVQQLGSLTVDSKSDMPVSIRANINYDISKQLYSLQQGSIKQNENNIQVHGSWSDNTANPFINLHAHIDKLTILNLLPWLPNSYRQQMTAYQLQGNLLGKVHLTRRAKAEINMSADFKLDNGSLLPKGLIHPIQLEQLTGKLCIPDLRNLNSGFLQINEYKAKLGDSYFVGSIKLTDLNKFYLQNHANVVIDLPTLTQALYPATNSHLQGQLVGSLDIEGNLDDLLHPVHKQERANFKGQLSSHDVQFTYNQTLFQLQDSSAVVLEDNMLNFKDLAGQIEGKPFVLTGKLNNWMKFWSNVKDGLCFEAKLYAESIALDKLLLIDSSPNTSIKEVWISPCLTGELLCDVEEVIYKRFCGNKVRGRLKLHNQELVADSVECRFAGGTGRLTGKIAMKADNLLIHTRASLQDVQLRTLFYTFENFHQAFLEDRHLGGRIWSDIDLSMKVDKEFHIDGSSVLADISVQLDKGILQNFEPLQRLAPYVSEKDLKYLHFSSLKNNIHIEDKTIYIPPMEVHTSVTSIRLSGTHTFDGKLHYNLVVPLQHSASREIKRQLPNVNEEALAGLNLYLKLKGDIHNYNLSYDSALFKANLKENLKKQGNILEEILQGRAIAKPTKELSKDEYFDFE